MLQFSKCNIGVIQNYDINLMINVAMIKKLFENWFDITNNIILKTKFNLLKFLQFIDYSFWMHVVGGSVA